MLRLTEVLGSSTRSNVAATARLALTFEDRRRSRLLVRLNDGTEAALMLPRGTVLRDGDRLRGAVAGAEQGVETVVEVRAAHETLSLARTSDPHLLTRAAYHLGNRHVPLQIGAGWIAYQHDHVLDDLVKQLGLNLTVGSQPFEPEAGGYGHGHGHEDAHTHDHDHGHNGR
jgi:urease accessory protein